MQQVKSISITKIYIIVINNSSLKNANSFL
jgi:hypothetical protein